MTATGEQVNKSKSIVSAAFWENKCLPATMDP